jgi:hypothetical protein
MVQGFTWPVRHHSSHGGGGAKGSGGGVGNGGDGGGGGAVGGRVHWMTPGLVSAVSEPSAIPPCETSLLLLWQRRNCVSDGSVTVTHTAYIFCHTVQAFERSESETKKSSQLRSQKSVTEPSSHPGLLIL